MAKQARLGDSGLTTFRVVCGEARLCPDVDERADLVIAEGDVLYTLERPTGMDPQQFMAGFSGPSFDCAKAKTTAYWLICADAGLSKSDRALATAIRSSRRRNLPRASRRCRRRSAAARFHDQELRRRCADAGDYGRPQRHRRSPERRLCRPRRAAERPNCREAAALVLEPRMRFRSRAKPSVEESDVDPWMSGGLQAEAFNAFVAKIYALARWRIDEKRAFPSDDDDSAMKYHARRSYSVTRFDARIVSFQIATDDYAGGNQDARRQIGVTWDMARSARSCSTTFLSKAAAGRPPRSPIARRTCTSNSPNAKRPISATRRSPRRSAVPRHGCGARTRRPWFSPSTSSEACRAASSTWKFPCRRCRRSWSTGRRCDEGARPRPDARGSALNGRPRRRGGVDQQG